MPATEAFLAQLLAPVLKALSTCAGAATLGFSPEEQLVQPVADAVDLRHGDPRQRRRRRQPKRHLWRLTGFVERQHAARRKHRDLRPPVHPRLLR